MELNFQPWKKNYHSLDFIAVTVLGVYLSSHHKNISAVGFIYCTGCNCHFVLTLTTRSQKCPKHARSDWYIQFLFCQQTFCSQPILLAVCAYFTHHILAVLCRVGSLDDLALFCYFAYFIYCLFTFLEVK